MRQATLFSVLEYLTFLILWALAMIHLSRSA